MIKFENVSFSFEKQEVLNNVSFQLGNGEFVGILGPNGGGKSTFLRLAIGLLKPQSGKITIDEERISYISQTTGANDESFPATVQEVVASGLTSGKFHPFLTKKDKNKIECILNEMELAPLRHRLVNELSGGQAQRVKVARALISDPSLIVLDEPDAGMDEHSHERLMETIGYLHKKGIGLLFVSHHPEDLKEADKICFIEDGEMLSYEDELKRGHHHAEL